MPTNDEIDAARAKLDREHAEVMESLGPVWVAADAVRRSEPTDNLHDLLEELGKAVDKARDGGLLGSGANDHRRALNDWRDLAGDD